MWIIKDYREDGWDQYISLWQPIPLDVSWRKVELIPVTWRVLRSTGVLGERIWK